MIPIVLHHGLFGFGQFAAGPVKLSYFPRIDRALAARGHPLITSRVHPTAGIATRARQLKETILRQIDIQGLHKQKLLVIGHSMGGLDARYMVSRLGMAQHVAALLTVTSPHRGSPYADWCLHHLGQRLGGLRLMEFLGLDVQAVADLTTHNCRKFNEEHPNVAGVKYFSVSAARPWRLIPPFGLLSYKIIYDEEGDNDCLVSVRSSTWGTHLGVWPADHFHTINKRFVIEIRNPTGDIAPFYLRAVDQVMQALEPQAAQKIA